MAAEFRDADGERHPGAQRRLVEQHGDRSGPFEGPVSEPVRPHRIGEVEDLGLLGR